ncbi:HIT family protein [Arthrobacter sp. HLT1-21]
MFQKSRTEVQGSVVTRSCRFCRLSKSETLVSESEYAFSMPSLGAMVEGWMLVSPRRHAFSIAELDVHEWEEFHSLASETRAKVEATYGPSVTFEHGASGEGRLAGCGINHAHLHIVPLAVDLRLLINEVSEAVGKYEWHRSSPRPRAAAELDYIHLSDRTGNWITHSPSLPSQVVRQAIARYLGLELWDWKSDLRESLALKTAARLSVA